MCLPHSQPVFYSSRKFANPPAPTVATADVHVDFHPSSPTPDPDSFFSKETGARRCEPPWHFWLPAFLFLNGN